MRSPTPGRSTLMISAPMSPRMEVQNGPESTCSKATTRTPSSARALFGVILDLGKQITPRRVRLLPHHHAARVVDHDLAVLLNSARAHLDDAPLRFGFGFALVDDFRFRIERVADEQRIGQFDLV